MDLTDGKDPFLAYFDNAGTQHNVIGQYGLDQKAKALSKEFCGHNMVAEQVEKTQSTSGTSNGEKSAASQASAVPLGGPSVSAPDISKSLIH